MALPPNYIDMDGEDRIRIVQSLKRYPTILDITLRIQDRDRAIQRLHDTEEPPQHPLVVDLEELMNEAGNVEQTAEWLGNEQPYGAAVTDHPLPSSEQYECRQAVAYWLSVSVDDLSNWEDILVIFDFQHNHPIVTYMYQFKIIHYVLI